VREKVKPERDLLTGYSVAEKRREYWWQYGTYAAALYRAIAGHERVLAISQTTSYIAFAFLPAKMIFSHKLIVFPAKSGYADFAVLQSRNHEIWALFWGSSLGDTPFYSPPDCLDTFPFPSNWEENAALEEAGKTYYEYRAKLMIDNDEGLTKTYNRFHDPDERSPDIQRLRHLHAAMDRAVLDAYGWTDIPTDCQFLLDYEDEDDSDEAADASTISHPQSTICRRRKKPWRYRWPDEVRDEVLARLLALNAERHAEEVRLGIAPGMKKSGKVARKISAAKGPGRDSQIDLFSPAPPPASKNP
jgi:hypothetical protein